MSEPMSEHILRHYTGDDGYVHSVDAAEALAKVVDEYATTIAALREQVAELEEALGALGAIGNGYCFCSKDRDPKKEDHEPECRDARKALAGEEAEKPTPPCSCGRKGCKHDAYWGNVAGGDGGHEPEDRGDDGDWNENVRLSGKD